MPEIHHLLQVLMDALTHNVLVQGATVSLIVAVLRKVFAGLDAKAKDPNQVTIVQALVGVLSLLTQLLSSYATGHLSALDPQAIIQTVETMIIALGFHQAAKDVKANPNIGPAGKYPLQTELETLLAKKK